MKSIKPGRGPSTLGVFGGIVVAFFGIIWTVNAAVMTGSLFAVLFGICFVALAIGTTLYHFHNATGENRYSAYDITDGNEEPDPFNRRYGRSVSLNGEPMDGKPVDGGNWSGGARFCPYCGAKLDGEFTFCPRCGREVPKL